MVFNDAVQNAVVAVRWKDGHRGTTCWCLLHALSNWILYTLGVLPAAAEPHNCDIHFGCPNKLVVDLTLNANSLLHVNATFTQCTIKTIPTRNTNNKAIRASAQQLTEADWLTKSRDSRCAGPFKNSDAIAHVAGVKVHLHWTWLRWTAYEWGKS
jgi:hypothetical protein